MGRVDAFYREQSYGHLRLTSDVYGLYTIPYSSSYSTNVSASHQAALDSGVDLSSYTAFYYLYPTGAPPGALANSYDSTFSNIAHELGHHIFGYYHHEHGIRCDSVTGTCASEEYGNRLSVMGLGQGHFSGMLKAGFGWLPPPQLIETSGDHTIEPLAAPPSGGAKTLTFNVCWSRWCTAYTLEYRQPIGFDDVPRSSTYDWNNVFGGVLFYGGSGSRLDLGTTLLQMTPYVIGTAQAPALAVGQSFCHKEGKVRVTVLSADATGARVRITYRTRCP